MIVTLIGYRGTGKTTVAADLAARLGWNFADVDAEIERRTGKSVKEIFDQDGEPYFRSVEQGVLFDFLSQDQLVLSTGGGTIVNPDCRARVMERSVPVWLQASVGTIVNRLQQDPETTSRRPSLTGTDPLAEIPEVLARRTPFYEEAAAIIINTDQKTVAGIVDEIITHLPAIREVGR